LSFGGLQGCDGGKIQLGAWVAVAYSNNKRFFVGKVTAIETTNVVVDFLTRARDGSFKWPKRKDVDNICPKFVFATSLRVQGVGSCFVLSNANSIETQFERYKKTYM